MAQSRKHSFLEALLNTASGFLISYFVAELTFAYFNFQTTHKDTFTITCIFTLVSIVRSYMWRRIFNYIHENGVI
jgi:biotin transporter BioY